MVGIIARRIAAGVFTLFVVSLLIFGGTELLPGDLASAVLGQYATPESVAAIRAELKLDRPAHVRYLEWLGNFVQGDLGNSLVSKRPMGPEIAYRLKNSLFLAVTAATVAVPLAIALGLLAATWRGSLLDRAISVTTLVTISVPEFFIGYLLVLFVSIKLGWLPNISRLTDTMTVGQRVSAAALPAATLVFVVVAHMMRMTRAAVVSIMTSPYIEMAVLKGIRGWRVVVEHALPNAVSPIVNVVMINLSYLVVGVVVVEFVFVYPGMGQLMVDAVSKHDVPVVQACGLIFGSVYVLLNLAADIVAIAANPRLRHPK